MKELEIKENGLLHKIALAGGFRGDGLVFDKAINKNNDMLRELWEADKITTEELEARRKEPWRPANFCEFSRRVFLGGLASIFFGLIILAIVFSAIFGGYALVDYAIHGFNKCGPMCQLGTSIRGRGRSSATSPA